MYWSHEDCTRGFLRRINGFNLGHAFIGAGHTISFRAAKDWSLIILQSTGVWCAKGTSRTVLLTRHGGKKEERKVEQQGIKAVTLCCYSTEYAECRGTFRRKFKERITENPYSTEKLIGHLALT